MADSTDPGPSAVADWTDQQWDLALAGLQRTDEPSRQTVDRVRSAMLRSAADPEPPGKDLASMSSVGELTPVGVASAEKPVVATDPAAPSRRRPWRRRVLLTSLVAALVAMALILPTLHWGRSSPPASAAAATALNKAADAATTIGARDEALKPVQYQYIGTDAWYLASSATTDSKIQFAVLQQSTTQEWVVDWHDTWMERRSTTGAERWIVGTKAQAKAAGMDPADTPPPTAPEMKGPCRNYFDNISTEDGNWQDPNRSWMAAFPRDPASLHARLAADTKGHGSDPNTEMLVYATDALRTGLLPADLRAALYRALAKVPGMEIADSTANLDGRVGVAFGIQDAVKRDETIIDPASRPSSANARSPPRRRAESRLAPSRATRESPPRSSTPSARHRKAELAAEAHR